MKTVSGTFEARTDAGSCPLCRQGFTRGEVCAFLKAHATGSQPDRALNRREVAEFKRAFATLQSEARRQGILPRRTRRGTVARRQRPASFEEVPGVDAPEWLWDHMVHARCLPAWTGHRAQEAQITARPNGRRTAGVGHGVALNGQEAPQAAPAVEAEDTPAAEEAAGVATEANENAATMQREIERVRNRRTPSWVASFSRDPEAVAERQRARAERQARLAEREAEAEAERNRVPEPQFADGARVPDLSDDPEPVTVPEIEEDDPSIQRFRLLDLD